MVIDSELGGKWKNCIPESKNFNFIAAFDFFVAHEDSVSRDKTKVSAITKEPPNQKFSIEALMQKIQ